MNYNPGYSDYITYCSVDTRTIGTLSATTSATDTCQLTQKYVTFKSCPYCKKNEPTFHPCFHLTKTQLRKPITHITMKEGGEITEVSGNMFDWLTYGAFALQTESGLTWDRVCGWRRNPLVPLNPST